MEPAVMEQEILAEPPRREVQPGGSWVRANLRAILCLGIPVLAIEAFAVALLGLPILDTVAFGIVTILVAGLGVPVAGSSSPERSEERQNKMAWIVGAFFAGAVLLWLSTRFAAGFAALAVPVFAFGMFAASSGVAACRRWAAAIAVLAFAVPWVDPQASYLSYPWRSVLVDFVAMVSQPLVGSVQVQGTSIDANSITLAMASDSGGFQQIQMFLLGAVALAIGRNWTATHRLAWAVLALITAAIAYSAFLVSYVVISVLAGESLPVLAASIMELFWWVCLFLGLWWLGRRFFQVPKEPTTNKRSDPRSESMFPK